jgi:hypothetical protein
MALQCSTTDRSFLGRLVSARVMASIAGVPSKVWDGSYRGKYLMHSRLYCSSSVSRLCPPSSVRVVKIFSLHSPSMDASCMLIFVLCTCSMGALVIAAFFRIAESRVRSESKTDTPEEEIFRKA